MKKTLFITLILLSFKLMGQVVPPPPPPPPPRPPEEVEELEEEDESEEDEPIQINLEDDEVEVYDISEGQYYITVDDQIFDVVEEHPEFIGGLAKLYEYIAKNIKYPEMAKENSIQGRVYVQFVVWKDGTIRDVNVIKGVHKTLDKEAIRVVKSMPKWTPGKQRGKSVNTRFSLPINFKIN